MLVLNRPQREVQYFEFVENGTKVHQESAQLAPYNGPALVPALAVQGAS
jgi:hypothetical protein